MNSFFSEDTKEEENLLQNILKNKGDKLPEIIEKITSHLFKNNNKNKKNELNIKSENVEHSYNEEEKNENNIIDKYTNEEKINFDLEANIFPFHIKKNGKINADIYFIPYKSEDNKDIITEYTYNYDYYDIYSENVQNINKRIHSNKRKLKEKDNDLNKKIKIKQEMEEKSNNSNSSEQNKKNFQKWLVHFRGRLFIGNNITYSFFKINTYLATLQNSKFNEKEIEDLHFVNKKIQTYNLIKSATYWQQDKYPDISDQNIQKLFFFLIIPPLSNYKYEEEINCNVVF